MLAIRTYRHGEDWIAPIWADWRLMLGSLTVYRSAFGKAIVAPDRPVGCQGCVAGVYGFAFEGFPYAFLGLPTWCWPCRVQTLLAVGPLILRVWIVAWWQEFKRWRQLRG